jgi:hypothetical protein
MVSLRILALLSVFVVSNAASSNRLFGFGSKAPFWDSFQVTFGLNPLKSYVDLPRTEKDALAAKPAWRSISTDGCQNGGKYNGNRYILEGDSSMSILYDIQGTVAGIQMNLNQSSLAVKGNTYHFNNVAMYQPDNIEGLDVYTLTVYFVDPSTICSTGRSEAEMKAQGTGTGLYMQNGPTPADLINVPNTRGPAIAQNWTKNKCFVGMGYHNFYDSKNYGDCTEFRPAFLLFNDGSDTGALHGFGLAAIGKAYSAKARYEYPSSGAINLIVGKENVSQCLVDRADSIGVTTIHVFFTNNNIIKHNCVF